MTLVRSRVFAAVLCTLFAACSADPHDFADHGGTHDAMSGDATHGDLDSGGGDDANANDDTSTVLDAVMHIGPDVQAVDGGGVYDDVQTQGDVRTGCDGGTCMPHPLGCATAEVCDDGLDNNCNGTVDEGCPCIPGSVQRCFAGPPGRRNVGACSDGQQTCQGDGEFGTWGPCGGGISPGGEACDNLDNNCDGCVDENLCCRPDGTCPGPGDPRIPTTGRPFGSVTLHGNDFLAGGTHYAWHVVGGPCDQLLFATSHHLSYKLNGGMGNTLDATGETLTLQPTLSGDYTVALTVTRSDGTTFTCTFIVPIRANGLRVELCWDTSGQDDLDLWLHRANTTTAWPTLSTTPGNVCYYANCRNTDPVLGWGYTSSTGGACREPASGGVCHNPRLDVDNIDIQGVPENINVDTPHASDRFRVAVNYYGAGSGNHAVHPMVNVYCGGALRATYGGATSGGMHYGATAVSGFNRAGDDTNGSLWRVADVTVNAMGGCAIAPLHPMGTTGGYCVVNSNDHSYNGTCAP